MSGKSEVIDGTSRMDSLKWAFVALFVAVGVYGNVYFAAESLLYRIPGLVVLGAVAAFVALQTVRGRAFWKLIKEAKVEIRKVVWPSRQETVQTTLVVVAVVLVMGVILWALDSLLGWLVSSLIG
ncbi:Protein translocase subunit SecE [invertebrate metagenome]|uniref:Protein translocase subunit SecE n=1 Tax=invertebrate metagenome TaxID=1711999 RepID=A0A2H9T998_9ZZZZ